MVRTGRDTVSLFDTTQMQHALLLAKKGVGQVNPNPMVGAVICRDGKVIAEGYHRAFGGPHAEEEAIQDGLSRGEEIAGCDIYVTLEPCSHVGKRPPCVGKIIDAGIVRCFVAVVDPNPLVAGKGIARLKEAGIEVHVGLCSQEASWLNRIFFHYIQTRRSYLFLKAAITLDGKIATRTGDSRWISNEEARERVHYLRHKMMGVMIGINTALQDDPRLTARVSHGVNPYRIVVDPHLRIDPKLTLIQENSDRKTILICAKEREGEERQKELERDFHVQFLYPPTHQNGDRFLIKDILTLLAENQIDSVLLEGGGGLLSSAFYERNTEANTAVNREGKTESNTSNSTQGCIDEGEIFIAPKMVSDPEAVPLTSGCHIQKMSESLDLHNVRWKVYGDNISLKFGRNR